MKVIGLTGGIGAGKSTVGKLLTNLGAAHVDADRVGHDVYAPGTLGWTSVTNEFGHDIVAPDGTINRQKLGAIVFADPAALARLNALVHPLILTAIAERLIAIRDQATAPAIVLEAAILLEAKWTTAVDEVWLVTARPEIIQQRLERDRGLSAEQIHARIRAQMPEAERRRFADVVIENNGSLPDLEAAVHEAWSRVRPS